MDKYSLVINEINQSISIKQKIVIEKSIVYAIAEAAVVIISAYKKGKKTLLAGNGGSAADAQHIAGEFVSRFNFDRPALASIALSTDTSILTAIGNDYGFSKLFSRQIEANGIEGDVFIGISTSGNSENILNALKACKEKKITTIGLTGNRDSKMVELCDICIKVPSNHTPRIQESHILIGHILCGIVEKELFKNYLK